MKKFNIPNEVLEQMLNNAETFSFLFTCDSDLDMLYCDDEDLP